jgi:carbon monoxide dehydrogenase subunit G
MKITKTFVVQASPEATWQFLTDPARVAQCLPGAAITGQIDERTHAGTVTMKVGPVTASFKGTLRFERIDTATRTAEIVASGQDTRGKGGADMRMVSKLVEKAPGQTEVTIDSDVNIIGTLAQFGRGIIQDVSDQVFDRFVAAVRAQLEPPAAVAGAGTSAQVATTGASIAVVPDAVAGPTSPAVLANPVAPIDVLSTASGAAGRAAGRAVRRPALWIGVAAVIVVAYWLFR